MENLDSLLISAPLSTALTIISGISFAIIFDFYGKKFFHREEFLFRAIYYFLGLLLTGWVIWTLCFVNLASISLFKTLLWMVILNAIFLVLDNPRQTLLNFSFESFSFKFLSKKTDIYFSWILKGALFFYVLLSLTVPTDADSLNYHLALPVDILNSGSLWFNKDYLCFRMAGFGEMINIIGVANGCPQLGAFLQMIGFLWFLTFLIEWLPNGKKLFSLTIFLSIPLLLFLLPNQKHQLTGILSTTLCFFFITSEENIFSQKNILILTALLCFAVGIKYSFLISAFVLVILLISKCRSKSDFFGVFGIGFSCFLIILGPVFSFRWIHFGDPLSPFFELLKNNPDPVILKPFEIMRDLGSALPFPVNLILPHSIGAISTVVGFPFLFILLVVFSGRKYLPEILAISFLFAVTFFTGQIAPRFFLEPIFWSILVILSLNSTSPLFTYLVTAVRLQFIIVLPLILFGLYSLGPSLLSDKLRKDVMIRSSEGYEAALWIDEVLPPDARICIAKKSRAYLNRPYFPWEYLVFSSLQNKKEADQLYKKLKIQYKVDYLILPVNGLEEFKEKYAGNIIAGPKQIHLAVRNPFNEATQEMIIYRMK